MSDRRIVARNKRIDEPEMSMAAAESYRLLEEMTTREHRGRGDTWEAARNRVAVKARVPLSYAARLWHRWKDMKDVSGEALLRLQEAYVASCEHHEAKARQYRAERLALNAVDTSDFVATVRTPAARHSPNEKEA